MQNNTCLTSFLALPPLCRDEKCETKEHLVFQCHKILTILGDQSLLSWNLISVIPASGQLSLSWMEI